MGKVNRLAERILNQFDKSNICVGTKRLKEYFYPIDKHQVDWY